MSPPESSALLRAIDSPSPIPRFLKEIVGWNRDARAWSVSHPRMLAVFLARKLTAASYGEIGQYFGGRNHSTAVAAEKKVRQWLQSDGTLALSRQTWRVRELIETAERQLGQ